MADTGDSGPGPVAGTTPPTTQVLTRAVGGSVALPRAQLDDLERNTSRGVSLVLWHLYFLQIGISFQIVPSSPVPESLSE